MPQQLALLAGAIFVYIAFRSDRARDIGDTSELFWPSLWYVVVASHPIGYWLMIWNIPMPSFGSGDDPTEGSPIDRYFFLILSVIALRILARRRFRWGEVLARNPWLTALLCFMAASILWSQYPYVSFKRYIKIIGSLAIAFVVLTHGRPLDSIFTVIRRCLYVHLPMSIICTRYYRDIGVSFDYTGEHSSWIGISTSKNTLGQIAMLGVLYFFWETRRHWKEFGWRNLHFLYLLMAIYLLKGGVGSISMTSVSVCVLSLLIFTRIQALRSRSAAVRSFVLTVFCSITVLLIFVLIHSVVHFSEDSIFGHVITLLGRDITMTGRTEIWHDVYTAAARDPLLGVGFGGFWIGRLANIPWNAEMTWVLGQGHSGYVDTYLQLGIVGGGLLAGAMLAALPQMLNTLTDDFDMGCFRITMFLTILFINITESTYLRGDHHLWLILMFVIWSVPSTSLPAGYYPKKEASLPTMPERVPLNQHA